MFATPQSAVREFTTITRLNAVKMREQAVLQDDYNQPVRSITFSPDSKTLVASTLDSLTLWDVARRKKLAHSKMSALHIAYSPTGDTLAVTGREIIFLDARTGKLKLTMQGHRDGTTGIAFGLYGRLFASGGMDGLVNIGDLVTRKLVARFKHEAPVRGLAVSPDGNTLATLSWGDPQMPRALTLWDIRTRRRKAELKCGTEKNLVFSPDGKMLAMDGLILSVAAVDQLYDLKERLVTFSPDSALAASCRSDFNSIGIWDMATGEQITLLKGHSEGIWSVAFSPDGRWLASSSGRLDTRALLKGDSIASSDNSVRLWGVELEETRPLRSHTGRLQSLPSRKPDGGTLTRPLKRL